MIFKSDRFELEKTFYPDLPKGYQISQFGSAHLFGEQIVLDDCDNVVRLTRIHMEEDAGKLNHDGADGIAGALGSSADLNRAGVPLIDCV